MRIATKNNEYGACYTPLILFLAFFTFCIMKGGVYMNKKINKVKILGIIASVIGIGATLVSNWVEEQTMEELIDEKVNAALPKNEVEESE